MGEEKGKVRREERGKKGKARKMENSHSLKSGNHHLTP